MSCKAVEQGQNEQPLKILPCISLQFTDIQTISPINLTNFELQLTSHPDRRKVDYVLNGLRFGFHLGFQPHLCKLKSAAFNCPSANEHPSVVDEYLNKEVSLGRVFGPTHAPPLQNLHVSRFGLIPKKGNAWRLILDLSFPVDHSVNDGIDKDDFSFQYCTVKHAINLIIKTGKGALMGKVPSWDGAYFFELPDWAPPPDFSLSSDASGRYGFGVYYDGEWFNGSWLRAQQPLCIAYKELFPIVLACHVWGASWARKRVEFQCDNTAVVSVIMSGTSKDEQLMHLFEGIIFGQHSLQFQGHGEACSGKIQLSGRCVITISNVAVFPVGTSS